MYRFAVMADLYFFSPALFYIIGITFLLSYVCLVALTVQFFYFFPVDPPLRFCIADGHIFTLDFILKRGYFLQ